MSLLFQSFDDEDKLKAIVQRTIEHSGLHNGVFVTLVKCINSKTSPLKESLFSCLLLALQQEGKLNSFFNESEDWNDGRGDQGLFLPAFKGLFKVYFKEGLNQGEMGFKKRFISDLAWG